MFHINEHLQYITTVKEYRRPVHNAFSDIFGAKISPQNFLRNQRLDHFASQSTKITIFKEIQMLIVDCTINKF